MKKINIVTVSNESYFTFLKVWIYSLYDKVDMVNVENIYIIDTGLNEEQKCFLKKFKKVKIHHTGINSKFEELHGKGWSESNYSKLPVIKEILISTNIPTYFIDVDCLFNIDFYSVLDFSKDMAICDTSDRKSLHSTRFIGSFYGFNNVNNLIFLEEWYEKIINSKKIITKWRESPALSFCYDEFKDLIDFQILKEGEISSSMFSPKNGKKYIYHMKSEGALGYSTPQQRLEMPHIKHKIYRYLDSIQTSFR